MVDQFSRRRATNLQDSLFKRGGPKELSSQEVSGMGVNAYIDEGTIPTPTCQGHGYHTGGVKTPPPTVPTVRHGGALECPEWAACHHLSVCQEGGAEEMAIGRRRDVGEHREGLSSLWQAYCNGHFFQRYGSGLDSGR